MVKQRKTPTLQDEINAMRCMASRDSHGNCYMQQYNKQRTSKESPQMCCLGKDVPEMDLIACPFYQESCNVNDYSSFEWLSDAADRLEDLSKKDRKVSRKKRAKQLWQEFGDIPMNPETECIEISWRCFPSGTHREEIWHWFEEVFHVSVADDLMFPEEGDVQ